MMDKSDEDVFQSLECLPPAPDFETELFTDEKEPVYFNRLTENLLQNQRTSGNFPSLYVVNERSSKFDTITSMNDLDRYISLRYNKTNAYQDRSSEHLGKILATHISVLDHAVTLGEYLRHLYENDRFADVLITVRGRQLHAHRVALCCFSNYFYEFFRNTRDTTVPFNVTFNIVSAEAFAAFLEFVYTGNLSLRPEIAPDLLVLIDTLDVPALHPERDAILKKWTLEETVKAVVLEGERSRTWYVDRIRQNFVKASKMPAFLDICPEIICRLLESDELQADNETEVYQTAIRWIVHNPELGLSHALDILQRVRFCYMTYQELLDCVNNAVFLNHNETFQLQIMKACWKITLQLLHRTDPFGLEFPPPRKGFLSKIPKAIQPATTGNTSERTNLVMLSPVSRSVPSTRSTSSENIADRSANHFMSSPKARTPPSSRSTTPGAQADRYAKPVMLSPIMRTCPSPRSNTLEVTIKGCAKPVVLSPKMRRSSSPRRIAPEETSVRCAKPVMLSPKMCTPQSLRSITPEKTSVRCSKPVMLSPKMRTSFSPRSITPEVTPVMCAKPVMLSPTMCTPQSLRSITPEKTSVRCSKPVMLSPKMRTSSSPRSITPEVTPIMCAKPVMLSPKMCTPQSLRSITPEKTSVRCSKPVMLSPKMRTSLTPEVTPVRCAKPAMLSPKFRTVALLQRSTPENHRCGRPIAIASQMGTWATPAPVKVDLYLLGGVDLQRTSCFGDTQKVHSEEWRRYCQLPVPRRQHAAVALHGYIYLLGGYNPEMSTVENPEPYNTVFRMDIKNKVWETCQSMNEARMSLCACSANGRIYVIGGFGLDGRILGSVEHYLPRTNQWTNLVDMPTPRYGACAAVVGGTIYIVGGVGEERERGSKVLDCVETFDTLNKRWAVDRPLPVPTCYAGLVNVGGGLYLVGGATAKCDATLSTLATVYMYTPKEITWRHITDLETPRHSAGIAAAGHRLYIFGGIQSKPAEDIQLQSVECFDTRSATWHNCVQLPLPVRGAACVSVLAQE